MRTSEIRSAYLIRALARGQAESCDRCDARMFVKHASGLCPFCVNDRPQPKRAEALPCSAFNEPFLPRLEARAVTLRRSWRTMLRHAFRAQRTLLPVRATDVRLARIRNATVPRLG